MGPAAAQSAYPPRARLATATVALTVVLSSAPRATNARASPRATERVAPIREREFTRYAPSSAFERIPRRR